MKPIQPGIYVDCGVEHNDKDPKIKAGYHLRIPKCKNIFAFFEKELQRSSQKKSNTEKVIKIKDHELHAKWKGSDN